MQNVMIMNEKKVTMRIPHYQNINFAKFNVKELMDYGFANCGERGGLTLKEIWNCNVSFKNR